MCPFLPIARPLVGVSAVAEMPAASRLPGFVQPYSPLAASPILGSAPPMAPAAGMQIPAIYRHGLPEAGDKKANGGIKGWLRSALRAITGRASHPDDLAGKLTDEKIRLLQEIFPEGIENSHISQKNVGDCYFLAALHLIKRHSIAPYLFASIIEKIPKENGGGWRVTFPGEEPIGIREYELAGQAAYNTKKGGFIHKFSVEGQPGDRILERAFGRVRKIQIGNGDGKVTMAVIEGGDPVKPLELFLADFIQEKVHIGDGYIPLERDARDMERARKLLKRFAEDPTLYMVTAGTPKNPAIGYKKDDKYYMDPGFRFNQNHAYSIIAADPKRELITIANPHKTRSPLKISYAEFFKFFTDMLAVSLDPDKLQDMGFTRITSARPRIGEHFKPNLEYELDASMEPTLYLGSCPLKLSITNDGYLFIKVEDTSGESPQWLLKPGEETELGRNTTIFPEMVSGRHAKVKYLGGNKVLITDLGSMNGTHFTIPRLPANIPVEMDVDHGKTIYVVDIPITIDKYRNRTPDTLTVSYTDLRGSRLNIVIEPGHDIKIGRFYDSDIYIADSRVSKHHLNIKNLGGGAIEVTDLDSTFGSYLVETVWDPKDNKFYCKPR